FTPPLPAGVTPVLSPATTTGEIYRYTLRSPKNALGQPIYTLNDLKLLQDWTLQREFKRVPRIMDVTGPRGPTNRHQTHPAPTPQLAKALPLHPATAPACHRPKHRQRRRRLQPAGADDPGGAQPRRHRRRQGPDGDRLRHEDARGGRRLPPRRGRGAPAGDPP